MLADDEEARARDPLLWEATKLVQHAMALVRVEVGRLRDERVVADPPQQRDARRGGTPSPSPAQPIASGPSGAEWMTKPKPPPLPSLRAAMEGRGSSGPLANSL